MNMLKVKEAEMLVSPSRCIHLAYTQAQEERSSTSATWRSSNPKLRDARFNLEGLEFLPVQVYNARGDLQWTLTGSFMREMLATPEPGKPEGITRAFQIWKANPPVEDSFSQYGMTQFAITLNGEAETSSARLLLPSGFA
jgi:hypothetical protein